eukprot:TRINITY_DN3566_c0_g2_i7.p1 TRINITY_DN3566_c0_g2~~TRINITY_DN3566_c0_g2_i7.p1  ORF type:complete len:483 (-),score=101.42 TRINITY_DN3566_c0_g2_i7:205-1653(-)
MLTSQAMRASSSQQNLHLGKDDKKGRALQSAKKAAPANVKKVLAAFEPSVKAVEVRGPTPAESTTKDPKYQTIGQKGQSFGMAATMGRQNVIPTPAPTKKPSAKPSMMSQLSEDERAQYGDRFPENYEKLDFLGRGGFALVWLSQERGTRNVCAIKQILKSNMNDSFKNEIGFGTFFFENGLPKSEFEDFEGMNHIIRMQRHISTVKDNWLVYELGGDTLAKLLFDIKGEFLKGERIYNVCHGQLYRKMREDGRNLRELIRAIAAALQVFAEHNIIHSDLKPDNILLDYDAASDTAAKIKLIDFGSAFFMDENTKKISTATPEYMPPEVLFSLLDQKNNCNEYYSLVNKVSNTTGTNNMNCSATRMDIHTPWATDVWSLGAIVLEILSGLPLWISLKCKVALPKKTVLTTGLLAVKGRMYDKILAKQHTLMSSLRETLIHDLDIQSWNQPEQLLNLLERMLAWNPQERISPSEILEHPYLRN